MPINDAGREILTTAIVAAIEGGPWKCRPYISGPSFDPAGTNPLVYGAIASGGWAEGNDQTFGLDLPTGDYADMVAAATANLTWTATSSETWPQTILGLIVMDQTNTLVAVEEFDSPALVASVGSTLTTSLSYAEGLKV